MSVLYQLKESCWEAPKTIVQLRSESAGLLMQYFFIALGIFGVIACLILINETVLRNLLLDYLFPRSWQGIMEKLIDFFFQSQARIVLSSLILNISLVAVSAAMFPLKERCSAVFASESGLCREVPEEPPLMYQLWGEIRLLILIAAAQLTILWLGYYAFQWTKWLSIVLSLVFLFYVFALDFISPMLLRHKVSYAIILKVLLHNPMLTFGFGVLYTLPPLLLSRYILSLESLSLLQMAVAMFLSNLVFLALAIPGGTRLAFTLLPRARQTVLPPLRRRALGYALTLTLFCISLLLHSRLALSLHHKSQFLKCEYRVDWGSVDFKLASWGSIKNGNAVNSLVFDLQVRNPTPFDLVVENSVLSVEQNGRSVAIINMDEFAVESGETAIKKIQLNASMNTSSLSDFTGLLQGWTVRLEFDLWPGIPFAIHLVE